MKNPSQLTISILTPAWNRSKFLKRVHDSICAQKSTRLEWIIVDDGSVDDTESVIQHLMIDSPYPVTYVRFSQRVGKSRADNILLDLAQGSFIMWCDSDDAIKPMAIEYLLNAWSEVPVNEKEGYIGCIGMCEDEAGRIQSTGSNNFSAFVSTWGDLGRLHGRRGDMCIMIRRDIVGDHRFAENDLVMTESGFWHQFMSMKVVCIPNVLKVMCRDTENRISSSRRMEYCRGKAYAIAFADSERYHELDLLDQLSLSSRYHRYSLHGDLSFSESNRLFIGKKSWAYYAGLVPGLLLALKDILQGRVVKTHLIFEEGRTAKMTVKRNALAEKKWESINRSTKESLQKSS